MLAGSQVDPALLLGVTIVIMAYGLSAWAALADCAAARQIRPQAC
jgi:hypothetical protein